jgi:hypothetical protein
VKLYPLIMTWHDELAAAIDVRLPEDLRKLTAQLADRYTEIRVTPGDTPGTGAEL